MLNHITNQITFGSDSAALAAFQQMAQDMLAGRTPKPDLKEAIHTLAIMEAMEQSMKTGKPVRVDEVLKARGICL